MAVALIPRDHRARRLVLLYGGLVTGGFGLAMFVAADLGLGSWDVLHQGISRSTGLSLGTIVILASFLVLLLWIPIRQRPGLGTLSNVVVIGVVIDLSLLVLPEPGELVAQLAMLLAALVINGIGTALYLAAGLGPGPRDGLMTGIAARGHSLRAVGVTIDVTVLSAGYLLGGTVGIGTVLAAFSYGPIVHVLLPRFEVGEEPVPVCDEECAPLTRFAA